MPSEWLTWSLPNLLSGMRSCVSQTLEKVVLQFFWLLGNLLADSLGPKYFSRLVRSAAVAI